MTHTPAALRPRVCLVVLLCLLVAACQGADTAADLAVDDRAAETTADETAGPDIEDLDDADDPPRVTAPDRPSAPLAPTERNTPAPPVVTEAPRFDEAVVEGRTLRCFPVGAAKQRCFQTSAESEPSGAPDAYCEATTCAELWFPSDLQGIDIAVVGRDTYACNTNDRPGGDFLPCEDWNGHTAPPRATNRDADTWCDDRECVPYDGDDWTGGTWQGRDYVCDTRLNYGNTDGIDCYAGTTAPPQPAFSGPDLYCDRGPAILGGPIDACSDLWYPADLDDHALVEDGSGYLLCDRDFGAGSDGYRCGGYDGGDPRNVYRDVYCYEDFGRFSCGGPPPDYEVSRIDGREYWCENTFDGSECWEPTRDGSPPHGSPVYYCDRNGFCSRDRF